MVLGRLRATRIKTGKRPRTITIRNMKLRIFIVIRNLDKNTYE